MDETSTTPPKCPCCNNPWAAATSEMFAQMCVSCEEEQKDENEKDTKNLRQYLDESVNPSQDFYHYANGTWIKENPIPAGYPSWNTFLQLHTLSQERLKTLLNNGDGKTTNNDDAKKVMTFYTAAMDEEKVETDGIEPLKDVLNLCDEAANASKDGHTDVVASCLGKLFATYGIYAFFSIGAGPDNKKSDWSLCQVAQGGLGLPDRDYYFDEDKDDKRIAYKAHIANMLQLLQDMEKESTSSSSGDGDNKASTTTTTTTTDRANDIYELELKLAEAHMTKTENRDPESTYNKMTLDEFVTLCSSDKDQDTSSSSLFDFVKFFEATTNKSIQELGYINIRNIGALRCASRLITTIDANLLRDYLRWRTIRSCSSYLSKSIVDEAFNFNEKVLAGTNEIKPRWKRAMAFTESALGEALGQMYCKKYFDESCKEKALSIVESVRQALEERLKEVDWIKSSSTREEALKKMSRFNVKIGYPDKWIDYTTLEIRDSEPLMTMVFKSRAFDHIREVKEMNAPTDKDKWFMSPQTVNAYYHPNLNEIVFPAAILQAPFFDPDADDAINFGSMGAVVGHEMTHGFDDKGRKFNFEGNMMDWWTKDDGLEYEKRVEVMVEQANKIEIHGKKVQGKLTCGENIADLGGLRLALRALKARGNMDVIVDDFTATQRFFLGWAACWRQNITKERALQLLTIDPHGPNPSRCNGPLSNMEEFHEAFNLSEDSPMYIVKESRVDIW